MFFDKAVRELGQKLSGAFGSRAMEYVEESKALDGDKRTEALLKAEIMAQIGEIIERVTKE